MKYIFRLLTILLICNNSFATIERSAGVNNISVDKTPFLKAIIEDKNKVILITRPHSWGSTFNMVSIENFFMPNMDGECCKNEGVDIYKRQKIERNMIGLNKGLIDKYFAKYPTILINLRLNKITDIKSLRTSLARKIRFLFIKHNYLMKSYKLSKEDLELFSKYMDRGTILSDSEIKNSIRFLSDAMYKHFEKPIIIMLHKYDDFVKSYSAQLSAKHEPLNPEDEYIKEAYKLYAGLILNSMKDNPNLMKGLIIGTSKIGKMGVFDKISNLEEDSLLKPKWGDYFGFTYEELLNLLKESNITDVTKEEFQLIKQYYGGYKLGGKEIYNSAGIMRMIDDYKVFKKLTFTHIRHISLSADFDSPERKRTLKKLLDGKSIEVMIDPEISYMEADISPNHFYAILFFEGFLAARTIEKQEDGKYKCQLMIPNEEILERFYMAWNQLSRPNR